MILLGFLSVIFVFGTIGATISITKYANYLLASPRPTTSLPMAEIFTAEIAVFLLVVIGSLAGVAVFTKKYIGIVRAQHSGEASAEVSAEALQKERVAFGYAIAFIACLTAAILYLGTFFLVFF